MLFISSFAEFGMWCLPFSFYYFFFGFLFDFNTWPRIYQKDFFLTNCANGCGSNRFFLELVCYVLIKKISLTFCISCIIYQKQSLCNILFRCARVSENCFKFQLNDAAIAVLMDKMISKYMPECSNVKIGFGVHFGLTSLQILKIKEGKACWMLWC
jgi:hypothetical protein